MKLLIAILIITLVLIGGCIQTTGITKGPTEIPTDPEGNFILFVSDQSFDISPVDIKVTIDGKIAVWDDFDVGTIRPQHNWVEYRFNLEPGKHVIKITSQKGEAELEEEFRIVDKHWAVINYWYYPPSHYSPTPKHFTFDIQDEPIGFE